MIDNIKIIFFAFTNFELKSSINFDASFLRVMSGDHLRSDKWKQLNRQNNLDYQSEIKAAIGSRTRPPILNETKPPISIMNNETKPPISIMRENCPFQ